MVLKTFWQTFKRVAKRDTFVLCYIRTVFLYFFKNITANSKTELASVNVGICCTRW